MAATRKVKVERKKAQPGVIYLVSVHEKKSRSFVRFMATRYLSRALAAEIARYMNKNCSLFPDGIQKVFKPVKFIKEPTR